MGTKEQKNGRKSHTMKYLQKEGAWVSLSIKDERGRGGLGGQERRHARDKMKGRNNYLNVFIMGGPRNKK